MNKIFQEYSIEDPVFRLVAILKSKKENFRKTTPKKSIFKVGSSESINKILENTCKEI